MPEGHSVHRLALQFRDVFAGRRLTVSSPQGRFDQGARLLDGRTLAGSLAHGKHLFLEFHNGGFGAEESGEVSGHGLFLHVHLGLYGAWSFGGDESFRGASSIGAPRKVGEQEVFDDGPAVSYAGPPAPVGAVRVRLEDGRGWADLRGATTCAVITEAEARAVQRRLGPDPLRNLPGDRDAFVGGVLARRTPLAAVLMDQKVVAGVGNVYRAELLFRQRLDPWMPGTALGMEAAQLLWDDARAMMSDGVRDGRIITTPPQFWTAASTTAAVPVSLPDPQEAHFVYRRHGLECRVCRTPIALTDLAARKLYWCPSCQQGG